MLAGLGSALQGAGRWLAAVGAADDGGGGLAAPAAAPAALAPAAPVAAAAAHGHYGPEARPATRPGLAMRDPYDPCDPDDAYDDAFNGQYDGKYTYDRVGFGPMEDDYGGSSDCGEDYAEDHEEQQTAEEILGDPANDIVGDRRELWRMAAADARLADGRLLADILPPTDPETAALQARLT